jgi:prepilin-type N-terminal cleavage/methylation domain-containing protein
MKTLYPPIDNHGFTLMEIMVAVFLLTIALLGLISTTVIVIKSNSLSPTMTTATALAGDKMEELRTTGFNGIASGGPETLQTIYSRSWTVACKDRNYSNNNCWDTDTVIKTITVTVTWSWQGQNHTVTLNTIVGL